MKGSLLELHLPASADGGQEEGRTLQEVTSAETERRTRLPLKQSRDLFVSSQETRDKIPKTTRTFFFHPKEPEQTISGSD